MGPPTGHSSSDPLPTPPGSACTRFLPDAGRGTPKAVGALGHGPADTRPRCPPSLPPPAAGERRALSAADALDRVVFRLLLPAADRGRTEGR